MEQIFKSVYFISNKSFFNLIYFYQIIQDEIDVEDDEKESGVPARKCDAPARPPKGRVQKVRAGKKNKRLTDLDVDDVTESDTVCYYCIYCDFLLVGAFARSNQMLYQLSYQGATFPYLLIDLKPSLKRFNYSA